jgi:hypothetical protein
MLAKRFPEFQAVFRLFQPSEGGRVDQRPMPYFNARRVNSGKNESDRQVGNAPGRPLAVFGMSLRDQDLR